MGARTQDAPKYYVWEVPGQQVVVHLHLDVIDRLLPEVMRGFGAVPKRGAEVGGLLIGTVEREQQTIIRIEDFDLVECTYKRGPSYLLTDEDAAAFKSAYFRWRPEEPNQVRAVGYFRSHTRDGFSLSGEDLDLLDHLFPEPSGVALLIRPFASKASVAGFFLREDGVFQESTPLEFPFRRRELAGDEPRRPRRALRDRAPEESGTSFRESTPDQPWPGEPSGAMVWDAREHSSDGEEEPPGPAYIQVRKRNWFTGWMWIPLAFVFLLLGVLLGFEAASIMGNKSLAANSRGLGLTVSKTGENLTLKWDPNAPAIRTAQGGTLEILDGGSDKPVDLDPAHLENGRIIYRNSSNLVRFRLTIYINSRLSIAETVDWQQ